MDNNSMKEWARNFLTRGRMKGLFRKDRLLIMLLSGILLLVLTFPASGSKTDTEETADSRSQATNPVSIQTNDTEEYAAYMERRLGEVLSQVSGVGKTKVMVTLRSTAEKVVEKDEEITQESTAEKDSQGGTRSVSNSSSSGTTVYSSPEGNSGEQQPYITKEMCPAVEGVVVIAQGGDDPVTVQNITEAVQALFNVDTHKIKVMKLQ